MFNSAHKSRTTRLAVTLMALVLCGSAAACDVGDPDQVAVGGADDLDIDDFGTIELVDGFRVIGPDFIPFLLFPHPDGGASSCTGTLITPRTVLTAAHCVFDANNAKLDQALVYFGPNPGAVLAGGNDPFQKDIVTSGDVRPHPDYVPGRAGNPNDVAIVRLDRPTEVPPMRLRLASQLSIRGGAFVRMFGYGVNEVVDNGDGTVTLNNDSHKRMGFARVPRSDFADANFIAVDGQGDFLANQCRGDSGGPIFAPNPFFNELIGISSFGDAGCELFSVNQRIDTVLDFIVANTR